VDVRWDWRELDHSLHHWNTKGQVWHKVIIHDIEVCSICTGNRGQLRLDIAKVRGEQGWMDVHAISLFLSQRSHKHGVCPV